MPVPTLETLFPGIKAGGAALPPAIATRLYELEVVSTYNEPDQCTLVFDLDANENIPTAFEIGKEVEVSFRAERAQEVVFKGEITAMNFNGSNLRTMYVIECQDKFHRFFRDDKTRTFLKRSISDVAQTMAGEHGVTAEVSSTQTKYDFLMQQNVSNGEWLLEQAAKRNYHARVTDGKLVFKKVGAAGDSNVVLEWGANLISFNARVTGSVSLKEATVRGWDPKQKKDITGQASAPTATVDPAVNQASWNSSTKASLVRTGDAADPTEAQTIAKAVMERRNEHNRQADGLCFGAPKLKVDKTVEIKGANSRFDGKYRVSHLRHRYTQAEGFMTEFACRGASDQSVVGVIQEAAGERAGLDRSIFDGVAVGIVTNNKDPEKLGRVKVKLPMMPSASGDTESDWMRVAFPGAGGGGSADTHHGWYLLPDVNDEVLVIFEQGDARRGYVLGGLLNGKDVPFYDNSKVVAGDGKVVQHAFRTTNGTHLLFDATSGKEHVERNGKNKKGFHFKFDDSDGAILTTTSGEKLTITNKGEIIVHAENSNIKIDAGSGNLTVTAQDITLDAKGKVTVKAGQDASLEAGANAKVKGNASAELSGAMAKVEGSGQTTIKGGMVMIN